MVKSAEATEQLLLLTEVTSPDPTLQVLSGPAAQFTHVCYLPETVTLGKSITFSLWGPAAGGRWGEWPMGVIWSKMNEHGIPNTARGSQWKQGMSTEKVEEPNCHGEHRRHPYYTVSSLGQEMGATQLCPQLPSTKNEWPQR